MTEMDKQKQSIEKGKDELKDLLIKKYAKLHPERTMRMVTVGDFGASFLVMFVLAMPSTALCFLPPSARFVWSGGEGCQRCGKEIVVNYNNKLREDDVLDMRAECEAEERDGKMFIGPQGRGIRGVS